ncbi:unnamed protein product, partial [Menidia menidia]
MSCSRVQGSCGGRIENVDACLSFLDARGVNVQGLSAEEIKNGNLKSILGLFFILSRYKQQQQQQQQYYQSLVELSQQSSSTSSTTASTSSLKTQDMQSSGEQADPLVWRSSRLPTAVSRDRKSRLPYGRANSVAKTEPSHSSSTAEQLSVLLLRGVRRFQHQTSHWTSLWFHLRGTDRKRTVSDLLCFVHSLTARYASPPGHSGIGSPQKKNTRLPGPSRVPAAGSGASRSPGSSNLNRRSQSFNSIDKSKPLQYASGNDREAVRGIPVPGGMNGSGPGGMVPTSLSGQQLASAIPSPSAGKTWRSKSMNLKHSATSSMLASPTHSPSTTPSPQAQEGLLSHGGEGSKFGSGVNPPQRSMLEKFRLINPRSASRASPSMAEMALQEEDDLSEYGEEGLTPTGSVCSSGSSSATAKQVPTKTPASSATAANKTSSPSTSSSYPKASACGSKSVASGKDKEDRGKSGKPSKDNSPAKEEREVFADSTKKSSKIASLIPKGGKSSSGKKDGGTASALSGIPKPGLKAPSTTSAKPQSQSQMQNQATLNNSGNMRAGEGERAKLTKGGQGGSFYIQRPAGGSESKRTSMTSSTSTSALSGSSGTMGGGGAALGGNGVVQLPQQQQHNHPNTATVAPFMYRTFSENDCTMVAPVDPCLSPTKGELVYSKTAKQCLEEISGEDPETRRMRTVKNIADLRQNLEETMSSLRGTQISH